jgi:hypothetical protein
MSLPKFKLRKKYFTDVIITEPITITWPDGKQTNVTVRGTIDHPKFTELREKLGANGLIEIERGWWNGDRVLKPFYLNKHKFSVGDKFLSAIAMAVMFETTK